MTKANELFKATGLSQAQAQAFVDFHAAEIARTASAAATASDESFQTTVNEWGAALKADPEIGGKLATVKADLGKAYNALIEAAGEKGPETTALVNDFKTALDLTGIGNHPAFVKVFHRMATMLIEPSHVAGRNPVSPNGPSGNPGLAASMYPKNS